MRNENLELDFLDALFFTGDILLGLLISTYLWLAACSVTGAL